TQGHEPIADRERLRFCRLHSGLLRNRLLLDANQRLPVGPIQEIKKTGLPSMDQNSTCATAILDVGEDGRRRKVVVPDIVMHRLKVPLVGAGLEIERDDGCREEIVASA